MLCGDFSSFKIVMSLLLLNTPISAAYASDSSVNLLTRTWAVAHHVSDSVTSIKFLVALPYQTLTSVFDFVIIDKDLAFDVVFGSQ